MVLARQVFSGSLDRTLQWVVYGNRRLKAFKEPELDKLVQKAEVRYALQNSIYTDLAKVITSKMGASHEAYTNALGWDTLSNP